MFVDDDVDELLDVQETLARYEAELSEELICRESPEELTSKATGRRKRSIFLYDSNHIRRLSTIEEQSLGSTRDLLRASTKSVAEDSDHNYQRRRSSRLSHTSIPIKLNDDNIRSKKIDGYSFLDAIKDTVHENEDNIFATWYESNGKPADDYTFGELWEEAGVISHYLRNKLALKKGDRIVLCYNFGLHFFASFLGCLRAGVIAVLVYPPSLPLAKSLTKMNKVVRDCDAKLILTDSDVNLLRTADMLNPLSKSRHLWPKDIKYKDTKKIISNNFMSFFNRQNKQKSETTDENIISPEDTAFLQYTSGSTGDPKGVMVTFCALAANVSLLHAGFVDMCKKNKLDGCSWLPQYHDLGLIVGNIVPFVSGWRMHMMSPLSFIQRPLLWLELMSHYEVDWSAAPNFAMKLVARKFVELKKKRKNSDPIPGLDLSRIKIQVCAEPVQAETKKVFEGVFKEYGLPEDWFKVGYGLAEHVVGVSYMPELHLSSPREEDITSMVAVGSRETFHHSLLVKIVCPETCQEMEDGKTGELWVSSPSVAGGYFKNPELTETVFHAKLAGSNSDVHYLRTGDLAFFQNHTLYICGRQKDLIIVNGVNYYPQDIEYAAQDASPAVRPGCVAAFSSNDTGGDGDLEVVFEIRNSNISTAEEVARAVRLNISKSSGLTPNRVVAIKEKTICKTTSGKIQRRANRKALHDGQQKIICDIGESKLSLKIAHGEIPPADLPSSSFPKAAVEAIRKIEADAAKLNSYFKELRLEQLPGVSEAWGSADKSTSTLQSMCEMTMQSLLQHYPSVVQFLHLLASHPEWVLGDGQKQLVEIVHCGFVMDWATQQLATNAGLLRAKLEGDIENEEKAMEEIGQEPVDIPGDTSFFVKGNSTDRLFGQHDIFGWMKTRSIQRLTFRLLEALENGKGCIEVEGEDIDWVTLNVLEATWLDQIMGRFDNASVGHWLCARSGHTVNVDGNSFNVTYEQEDYTRVYMTWNLAIMTAMPNAPFVLSKLLIPSVAAAPADRFFLFRLVSLYLAIQKSLDDYLQKRTEPNILSPLATQAFGCLNKRWAYSIDYNEDIDWTNPSTENPPELPTGKWFRRFEEWKEANECHKKSLPNLPNSGKLQHSNQCCPNKKACGGDCKELHLEIIHEYDTMYKTNLGTADHATSSEKEQDLLNKYDAFEKIMVEFFGSDFDKNCTWDELGLSSLASVSLRDKISDEYAITLSSDCLDAFSTPDALFERFQTPVELKEYVVGNQGTPLEVKDSEELKTVISQNLPWWFLGSMQAFCSIFILFMLTAAIVPAWYAGKFFAQNSSVSMSALGQETINIKWLWLPFIVPTWMLSFSFSVIVLKWIVIWKYKEGIVPVLSTAYLRWWFVDRAVSLWEFWVGRFVKGTPLMNLFYVLMGAKIHKTVLVNAFIRESDLVDISEHASIESQLRCRKFDKWEESSDPSMHFRSVVIGSNSKVKGMVSLGSSIGDAAVVCELSVVPEGAIVPSNATVTGNPAFSTASVTHTIEKDPNFWWALGILKILWLVFELYLFFGVALLGQYLWLSQLPHNWRYTPVLYWSLLLVWFSFISVGTSIIIKWTFIGKRKQGPYRASLWTTAADWAADWHFEVGLSLLCLLVYKSRIWNVVLMMHGMDIDFVSLVIAPQNLLPSKLDLVKIRKSFISVAVFKTKHEGAYHQISVDESSISHRVTLGGSNLEVLRKVVPPLTHVTKSISQNVPDQRFPNYTFCQILQEEISRSIGHMVLFLVLFGSLIPSYELWTKGFNNPASIWVAVPALASTLALQTISLSLILILIQSMALAGSKERVRPWNTNIFLLEIDISYIFQAYSLLDVMKGSPAYNFFFKCFGGKIEGRALLFPERIYEFSRIKFIDRAVVDSSFLFGHFGVYDDIVMGECEVGGVLHEGVFVASSSVLYGSDPWRVYVGTLQGNQQDRDEVPVQMSSSRDTINSRSSHKCEIDFGTDESRHVFTESDSCFDEF